MTQMPNIQFIFNVKRHIRGVYDIDPTIFQPAPTSEDPFYNCFKVRWKAPNRQTYLIEISQTDLGPARERDFVDIFDEQLEFKYPELLL